MASDDMRTKNPVGVEQSGLRGVHPKVVWDDSNMRNAYANVTHVTGGREEIILLFGMNQAWHSAHREVTVALSDRIVMNPYAAKRFSVLLSKAIKNYEKQYGKMELEIRRPQGVTLQ